MVYFTCLGQQTIPNFRRILDYKFNYQDSNVRFNNIPVSLVLTIISFTHNSNVALSLSSCTWIMSRYSHPSTYRSPVSANQVAAPKHALRFTNNLLPQSTLISTTANYRSTINYKPFMMLKYVFLSLPPPRHRQHNVPP